MAFDIDSALSEGYSKADVLDYLSRTRNFDLQGALNEGYSEDAILNYFKSTKPKAAAPTPASTKRSYTEAFVTDPLTSVASGVGKIMQFPGQLGRVIGGGEAGPVEELGKSVEEYWAGKKSPGLVAREQARAAKMAQAEKEGFLSELGTAVKETITDPALLSTFLAEQIPQLLVTGGVGKGVQLGVRAAMAKSAKEAVESAALKAGVTAEIGTAALMQGVDVGSETYENALKALQKQGITGKQAQEMALAAGQQAAFQAGLVSVGSQMLPGARRVERAILGGKTAEGVIPGAIKAGVGEAVSEGIEEGGGRLAQNLALTQVDPNQRLLPGVGGAMGLGMVGGLGVGAPLGAISGLPQGIARLQPETPPRAGEPPETERRPEEAASPEVLAQFDALVAQYMASGASEAQAMQAAGAELVKEGVDFGRTGAGVGVDTGRGDTGVPVAGEGVEPGGRGAAAPAAEPAETGVGGVAATGSTAERPARGKEPVVGALEEKVTFSKPSSPDSLYTPEASMRNEDNNATLFATGNSVGIIFDTSRPSMGSLLVDTLFARVDRVAGDVINVAAVSPKAGNVKISIDSQYIEVSGDNLFARLSKNDRKYEERFRAAFGDPAVDTFFAGGDNVVARTAAAFIGQNLGPEFQKIQTAFENHYSGVAPKEVAQRMAAVPESTLAGEAPLSAQQQAPTAGPETAPEADIDPKTGMKPPGKRGRKAAVRTPEEEATIQAQRKKRQQVGRDTLREAERAKKVLETPFRKEDYPTEEAFRTAGMALLQRRAEALAAAMRILNDRNISPTAKAKQIAKEVLAHPSIMEPERQRLRATPPPPAGAKTVPDMLEALDFIHASKKNDPTYGRITTALEGINHILKTGNPFERALAQRIKPFMEGMRVVIVRDPQQDIRSTKAREGFTGSRPGVTDAAGLYFNKTIYLNADPRFDGFNNVTFLHEALHGATLSQIAAWLENPASVPLQVRLAIEELESVRQAALKHYKYTTSERNGKKEAYKKLSDKAAEAAAEADALSMEPDVSVEEKRAARDKARQLLRQAEQLNAEIERMERINPLYAVHDRLLDIGAFTDLKEFVTYGMTQPEMQDFLMRAPGKYRINDQAPNRGLLSMFVRALRRMYNMLNPYYSSAFQDLVIVTDKLLKADPAFTPETKVVAAARTVRRENRTLAKIATSNNGSDLNASIGELMAQTRNSKDALRLLRSIFDALTVKSVRMLLPVMTTADITRWGGKYINNLKNINTAVESMAAMRNKMIREIAEKVPAWVDFNTKYKEGGRALGDAMHIATLENIDFAAHPTLADALQNDQDLKDLRQELQTINADPTKTTKQKGAALGEVRKRENNLRIAYEGGTIVTSKGPVFVAGWNPLGKYGNGEGHKIFRMALDAYKKTANLHQQLLVDKISKSDVPGKANDPATPKGQLVAQITKMFQDAQQLGVYFPLMRYGDFWLRVGKDNQSEFYMFESAVARNNFARKRAEELSLDYDAALKSGEFKVGDDPRKLRIQVSESSEMLKNIFAALDANGQVDPTTGKAVLTDIKAVKDQVYQMFLMTLPDKDMRKRFTHRQGRTGFSADVLRNFIVSQHTAANQLSRLAYADKIRLAIGSAYSELAGNPNRLKLAAFVDEFSLRAGAEMTPTFNEGFFDAAARMGNQAVFFWMLTSPKSALVQLTQLATTGMPALVSKYGFTEATKTIGRYSFLFNKLGTTKVDEEGNVTTEWGQPSINDSSYVNKHPDPVYRAALKQAWKSAQDLDIFMSTYTADMTSRAKMPSGRYEGFLTRGSRAALNFISGGFHHMERLARESMYMATFELEFAKAKKDGLQTSAATSQAIKVATDTVRETLFNYTQYNKPRVMQSALGRVGTQFMSYPLQMTSYLTRNFFGMLPYLNKEGKRDAAIKFFGLMGMTGVFAGVTGLPGYSALLGLAEGIREAMRPGMDDDEADPWYDADDDGNPLGKRNLDLWFREWFIPTYFGPGSSIAEALGLNDVQALTLQRAVKMGPVSALTDLNIGSSVSLDGLWFRDDTPAESTKAAFTELAFKLLGPLGSLIEQFGSAFDDFNSGHFNRGVEKMLPAFFRGTAKAIRAGTEGEMTRQGAEIREAEWFTTGKLVGLGLGFQSTEIAEVQKKNFLAKRMIMDIQKERMRLLNKLDLMVQNYNNDPSDSNEERMADVLLDISTFNYKNSILAISSDTIEKSLKGRAERRMHAAEGLMLESKIAPYVAPMLERSTVPR